MDIFIDHSYMAPGSENPNSSQPPKLPLVPPRYVDVIPLTWCMVIVADRFFMSAVKLQLTCKLEIFVGPNFNILINHYSHEWLI